jgi:hypothetical protein
VKLYLSKRLNGLYQLTALPPTVVKIVNTELKDVYPQPGDPVIFQGLCPFSVKRLFGKELQTLEISRVRLTAKDIAATKEDEFLQDLQDPTTSEGAWNLFYGLWGGAQSQPGFDYKAWLAVRDYFKGLDAPSNPTQEVAALGDDKGRENVRMSNLQHTTATKDSV